MGTWGTDTFDNDTAGDWAFQLEDEGDLDLIDDTLARVVDSADDDVDSDVACEALAACEVVARLKGNFGVRDAYTEPVDKWVAAHPMVPPHETVARALAAIDRILGPQSELAELWSDSDDARQWRAAVSNLRQRVAG
jgi:hypothetical protein